MPAPVTLEDPRDNGSRPQLANRCVRSATVAMPGRADVRLELFPRQLRGGIAIRRGVRLRLAHLSSSRSGRS